MPALSASQGPASWQMLLSRAWLIRPAAGQPSVEGSELVVRRAGAGENGVDPGLANPVWSAMIDVHRRSPRPVRPNRVDPWIRPR
jgi:hypothetical protein